MEQLSDLVDQLLHSNAENKVAAAERQQELIAQLVASSAPAQVGEVLLQFGPGRLKKTSEMSVASFTHEWQEQLPDCMVPTTDPEYRAFADLIKRSLFYYCLDDKYLQKELCELGGVTDMPHAYSAHMCNYAW